jgi:hypothetical protein
MDSFNRFFMQGTVCNSDKTHKPFPTNGAMSAVNGQHRPAIGTGTAVVDKRNQPAAIFASISVSISAKCEKRPSDNSVAL